MKAKDLIKELENHPDLEVRIMDVTKEDVNDETECPTFDFKFADYSGIKQPFLCLEYNPDKQ